MDAPTWFKLGELIMLFLVVGGFLAWETVRTWRMIWKDRADAAREGLHPTDATAPPPRPWFRPD